MSYDRERIKCSKCGENNFTKSAVCWRCGEPLKSMWNPALPVALNALASQPPQAPPYQLKQDELHTGAKGCLILLVALVIGGCILAGFITSDTPGSSGTSGISEESEELKGEIISAAQDFIKDRLLAPGTAKFPWRFDDYDVVTLDTDVYRVSSWVDSQNAFGALLRKTWTVELEAIGEGNWRLVMLNIW